MKDSKGYDFERIHARNKREQGRVVHDTIVITLVVGGVLSLFVGFGLVAVSWWEVVAINF